ncbi:related to Epsin-3 [Hanseniaspora guilliermondii]|uniref:Related to Epsin-3 n=1 Tax=Hanseniaspora guilliermondii TaxID=56406 RepID=A0A1L0CRP4_9ASCO|nr:related to Epsin-3 [Hanseniaspora guilliermondii]
MSIEDTLSNLSLYDAKKYFRKAQNLVYNYTDMESKVREATNNEPWGTPSSLMEQISQGSFNYKERTEIIGMIFKRFTEKTSMEWRQIYKALQLLEYIIKHGSERFVDDCRSNLSIISMLRDFHYIDSQGTDQGLNVRTRATAIVDLLKDNDKIRAERKKAKELQSKVAGSGGSYNASGVSGRTGGFTKSNRKGISVSADFDDDNLVRNYHSYDDKSYGEYKEEYIVENRNTHKKESEDTTKNAVPDLLDNLDFDTKTKKVDEDDEFGDFICAPKPSSNKTLPKTTVIPQPVKQEDPFASLFSEAKVKKSSPDDAKGGKADDDFGDFLSSTNNTKTNTTGDVDLLSF